MKMISWRYLLAFSFATVLSLNSYGQLSGYNLAEAQFGQIPTDTLRFGSFYDRLVIDYDYKAFKFGLTGEQYWSQYGSRNYAEINQVRLQYKTARWDVKIGNFYETLGRGTLLRTYQVQGAVVEDIIYRSRTYFHRDFVGAFAKYQQDAWSIKAMAGQPLQYQFPPTQDYEVRRPDSVIVIGGDYQLLNQKIEYNAMNVNNAAGEKWYSMANLSGKVTDEINYYTEVSIDNEGGLFEKDDSYAAYLNVNFVLGNLSITSELKDYRNFQIGEGINEPPALIKQHLYRTLNRSTHIPNANYERGWQLEALYYFDNGNSLTFNHARARNALGNRRPTFTEFFVEYDTYISDRIGGKFFADYAIAESEGEENRLAGGYDIDYRVGKKSTINVEFEYQTFDRNDESIYNSLAQLGYSVGSKFSASVLAEISNDPTLDDDFWLGTNVKYKPSHKDTFLFFGGTRRGGPACTSGVCYEILDFEGVELRYTRRF